MTKEERMELFGRLLEIQSQIDDIKAPYQGLNEEYSGPLAVVLTSPSGKRALVELFDRHYTPHPGDIFVDRRDELALRDIDTFLTILSVPAFRDEFREAARKILRKGVRGLEAAEQVATHPNPESSFVARKHETYKDHPLYAEELENQKKLAELNAKKLEICAELKLVKADSHHEHLPGSEEVALFHRKMLWTMAADERANTTSPNP